MNKKKYMLYLLMILLLLSGCTKATKYLDEYTYLPAHDNMVQVSFQEPTDDKMGAAVYKVENKTAESFFEEYESILKKEGWEVTTDNKPESIVVEKDEYRAIITATESDEDLIVNIISK